jgi:hypothetical protein
VKGDRTCAGRCSECCTTDNLQPATYNCFGLQVAQTRRSFYNKRRICIPTELLAAYGVSSRAASED